MADILQSDGEVGFTFNSVPVGSHINAGEYGLFLKINSNFFVPVTIDPKTGHSIGDGDAISIKDFPSDVTLRLCDPLESIEAMHAHASPTLLQQIGQSASSTLRSVMSCITGRSAG